MPNHYWDHIHLISPDPLKTAGYYEETFGAKRISVGKLVDGRTNVYLDLGGSSIFIVEPVPGSASTDYGLGHIGIRTDDIEASVARLKAGGAKFKEEIRAGPRPGVRVSFFWAPDNVLVELLERKSQ